MSGWYWVYDKSEVENGWSVHFFNGEKWNGYAREEPDKIGPEANGPVTFASCPSCGESECIEVSAAIGEDIYYVRCGYCGRKGPLASGRGFVGKLNSAVKIWNNLNR